MVCERDRARMRLIGEAVAELNREAVEAAARRTPGENVELGLRLGEASRRIAPGAPPRPDEVPPLWIWRELKRRRRGGA